MLEKRIVSWPRWLVSTISAFWGLRLEKHHEFQAVLNYLVSFRSAVATE